MRCGYRCKKGRRDNSKRTRPHNPTRFSLRRKGMKRGGTRRFNSFSVHLGVMVHASRGKGCRLYQCWVGLGTNRCLIYERFHSIEMTASAPNFFNRDRGYPHRFLPGTVFCTWQHLGAVKSKPGSNTARHCSSGRHIVGWFTLAYIRRLSSQDVLNTFYRPSNLLNKRLGTLCPERQDPRNVVPV